METRRYRDPENNRWTTETLAERKVRSDGSIQETWNGQYRVHHWAYVLILPLALLGCWPLGLVVLLGWAHAWGSAAYTRYIITNRPDSATTNQPQIND